MLKHERIRITTAGEEANHATTLRAKFGIFTWRKLTIWKVKPWSTIHVECGHFKQTLLWNILLKKSAHSA